MKINKKMLRNLALCSTIAIAPIYSLYNSVSKQTDTSINYTNKSIQARAFPSEWSSMYPSQVDTNSSTFRNYMVEFLSNDANKSLFSNTQRIKFNVSANDDQGVLTINNYTMAVPYSGLQTINVNKSFGGFKGKKVTYMKSSIESNGINASGSIASKAPYEINNSLITEFISNNKNNIFDYPASYNSSQVTNITLKALSKTSASVTFTVPTYGQQANVLENKSFTLKINNLQNKDTALTSSNRTWSAQTFNIDLPVRDITDSNLPQLISKNQNFRSLLFTNYPSDFTIAETRINSRTNSSITFNFKMSKIYWNGKLSTDNSDCTWGNFVINGFDEKLTNLKSSVSTNGINGDQSISSLAPYEITEDKLKSFIYSKRNEIFDNVPSMNNQSQIVVKSLQIASSTSLRVSIGLPSFTSGQSSATTEKTYDFTINGLSNKDTVLASSNRTWSAQTFNIDLPVRDITDSNLPQLISKNQNFRNLLFTNYPSDFTIAETRINSRTNSSITFNFKMSKIYWNGKLSTDNSDCTWSNFVINGFDEKLTALKSNVGTNGINGDQSISSLAPYEITEDKLKSFIYSKRNEIFDNVPSMNNQSQIVVKSLQPASSTSLRVSVGLPSFTSGQSSTITEKTYDFTINGLSNKETSYISSSSSQGLSIANSSISNLTPWEIKQAILTTRNQDTVNKIKEFIYQNRTKIFNNISTWNNLNASDCISINSDSFVSNTDDSVILNFSVKSICENGSLTSSWSQNKYQLKLINLPSRKTTMNNETIVTGELTNKSPSQISIDEIKEYILSNNLIINKPNNFLPDDLNIIISDKDDNSGTITAIVQLSKYYTSDGEPISSGNTLNFKVKFLGFADIVLPPSPNPQPNPTPPGGNASTSSNDNNYMIWIYVGISMFAFILIVLVIFFIYIKKRTDDNRRKLKNKVVLVNKATPLTLNSSVPTKTNNTNPTAQTQKNDVQNKNVQPQFKGPQNIGVKNQAVKPQYPNAQGNLKKPLPPQPKVNIKQSNAPKRASFK